MKFYKLFLLAASGLIISLESKAQLPEGFKAEVEIQATGTTNKVVPFWMRSNQYGSVPLNGVSGSLLGRFNKDYDSKDQDNKRLIDWGFGFEGRANGGKGSNLILIEGYLKGRLSIFQLKAGRTKDVMGLNGDTTLSSGNFAVSGNALGIPKVELSIPDYYRIPVFGGLFSFKGNFSHGYLGRVKIIDSIVVNTGQGQTVYPIVDNRPVTYFHQKSLYVRLGKADWKLSLIGGFNHQVQWGNEKAAYGENFKLSDLETFFHVVTGKTYGSSGVPTSKIGNQLGSIDVGIQYDFNSINIILYRQSFYDVGALSKLANIADGLNGVTVKNKLFEKQSSNFQWKKITAEVFYSKNQAGYPWSKFTKSGDEDYYNNFYYVNGWSYNRIGIGSPLVTSLQDLKNGQAKSVYDYFVNNRVESYHLGFEGQLSSWEFLTKITFSRNFGTFHTSIYGSSTGSIRNPQTENLFIPVNQLSVYFGLSKRMLNNYVIGTNVAFDHGDLLNKSFGGLLTLKKSF